MLEQQYTMLKYVIDYPAEKEMKVTAVDPGKIEMVKADGLDTGLYELQLLEQKKLLTQKQTKLAKDGYLPSLSLTGNLMYSAFTDRIDHWIHSGESNHWYGSNGLGIQLRVPVFDGFEKRSKIRKAKIDRGECTHRLRGRPEGTAGKLYECGEQGEQQSAQLQNSLIIIPWLRMFTT